MKARGLKAALAVALSLLTYTAPAVWADAYRVCYLKPDEATRTVTFCPPAPSAATSCTCENAAGTVSTLTVTDEDRGPDAANDTVCVFSTAPGAVSICRQFQNGSARSCRCGGHTGTVYHVNMTARFTLRTNPVAQADFLKRLKECCVQKP